MMERPEALTIALGQSRNKPELGHVKRYGWTGFVHPTCRAENMMNRVLWTWTVAATLAALACPLSAQRSERGESWRERAGSRPVVERARQIERVIKDLNLSDEQRKQVQQIFDTHQQALRNWRRENFVRLADLRKQLEQARDAKDADKLQTIRGEIEKIEQSRKTLFENLQKQLKDVLKPEQFDKVRNSIEQAREQGRDRVREEHPGLAVVGRLLGELKLSDEQKRKVQAIFEEAKKQADVATDPAQKEKIRAAAIEKIKKEVLTQEQADAADRLEAIHRLVVTFGKLNLSDDQKQQVKTIMDQAKEQAQKAVNAREKQMIFQQAFRKINDTVLTAEQQAKLKEIGKGRDRPRDGRKRQGHAGERTPAKTEPDSRASGDDTPEVD